MNKYSFTNIENLIFGDRSPAGYTKVRLLSKIQNQIYWLFKAEAAESENEDQETYFII